MNRLLAHNLCFERNDVLILKNIAFQVQSGECLYIQGPNGQGKTTLLKLLSGILSPNNGEILWNDQSIFKQSEDFLKILNYIGHQSAVHPLLTPKENLSFLARFYKTQMSCDEALEKLDLNAYKNVVCGELSAGLMRRVALARLVLLKTPLWCLDEPFNALDKKTCVWLQALMNAHLKAEGLIILTSHDVHHVPQEAQTFIL